MQNACHRCTDSIFALSFYNDPPTFCAVVSTGVLFFKKEILVKLKFVDVLCLYDVW